jgi:hypothetical protein
VDKIFCTKDCQWAYRHKTGIEHICKGCGVKFEGRKGRKYCSVPCARKYNYKKSYKTKVVVKKCLYCDKEFTTNKKNRKFCSKVCGCKNRYKKKAPNRYIQMVLDNGRRITEHRYVMEKHLGRKLKSTEVVYHVDLDTTNNNIDNLFLYDANSKKRKEINSSLRQVASSFIKKGLIKFEKGKYHECSFNSADRNWM